LTGDTLAAGITASSLQSVGVLNGLTMSNNIAMANHDITGQPTLHATTFMVPIGNAATGTTLANWQTLSMAFTLPEHHPSTITVNANV